MFLDRRDIPFYNLYFSMSSNKEDIVAQLNEDNYTNVLEDSDVDDIADKMKLICDIESEEYR